MQLATFIDQIKQWVQRKFTGIVHVHFHQGGIRKVRVEHDVEE